MPYVLYKIIKYSCCYKVTECENSYNLQGIHYHCNYIDFCSYVFHHAYSKGSHDPSWKIIFCVLPVDLLHKSNISTDQDTLSYHYLLWIVWHTQLLLAFGHVKGLVKGHQVRSHRDGEHGVVCFEQLGVVQNCEVGRVSVGQAVQKGVVRYEDVSSTGETHVIRLQQEVHLLLPTNQHRVHTHDNDCETQTEKSQALLF